MPDTDQKSRLATLGSYALGKVLPVLWKEFSKIVLRGRKTDAAKKTPVVERSEPVTLPNGKTAVGIIRDNVLQLVSITDKGGNTLEMEPEFFDTGLLNLKKEVFIPKFE